jgi:hypothetical protein
VTGTELQHAVKDSAIVNARLDARINARINVTSTANWFSPCEKGNTYTRQTTRVYLHLCQGLFQLSDYAIPSRSRRETFDRPAPTANEHVYRLKRAAHVQDSRVVLNSRVRSIRPSLGVSRLQSSSGCL